MDWPLPCGPHGQWLYDHSGQTKELRHPPWSFKALPRGGTPSLGEEDLGQTIQSVHILWKSWCLISTNSLLLFRMALARHPDSSKHRRLVYRCTSCSYFGDQRALQAHVVTRQVPLEEAPNFFRVCHIKYVQADHWVRHANNNSQRVRVMVCPSPGGQTPLGRGTWTFNLTGPCPDATHWGSQDSKRFFQHSRRARPGASKYSLADLLATLPPAPVASGVAPEPMAQEAEGMGQSLGGGEVAPEPQREAEQLVAQEPSEVVTELVEVQPGEAAQTTPAQEPGSSIVEKALSSRLVMGVGCIFTINDRL